MIDKDILSTLGIIVEENYFLTNTYEEMMSNKIMNMPNDSTGKTMYLMVCNYFKMAMDSSGSKTMNEHYDWLIGTAKSNAKVVIN